MCRPVVALRREENEETSLEEEDSLRYYSAAERGRRGRATMRKQN